MRYRLSAEARIDISGALQWSQAFFGISARTRYGKLITIAVQDVSAQPFRVGSKAEPRLGEGVRIWHLRLSRDHVDLVSGRVKNPRHFLIYRVEGDLVVIGRLLHDATEFGPHQVAGHIWQ